MTWKQVLDSLQSGLAIAGEIDPNIKATEEEISALTDIASGVVGTISSQSGAPISDVLAGLHDENTDPDK